MIRKKIRRDTIRVAYVYPSIYEAMAASLASHIIYYMINEYYPEVYMERFHTHKLVGEEPPPRSLETESPLRDFPVIITSIHYELNIASLIRILKSSGIEPLRRKRDQILLAGGPAVMANPYPYSEIVDAFIIGEIEESIPAIMDRILPFIDDKKRMLEELAGLRNVYVPGYKSDRVYRSYTPDLDQSYYPIRQFYDTVHEPVYGYGLLLESSRGCRFWCRFCMEGRLFKPYRRRSYSVLKRIVDEGLEYVPRKRIVFYSLNFLLSPHERQILEYLSNNGIEYSVPSLRIELINDDLLDLLKAGNQKTLTLAPESFSLRMHRLFGKYDRIKWIIDKLRDALRKGFKIKLYLISGVKGETIDDVKNNIEVLRMLAKYARAHNTSLSVTINPLVPKPKTMFQWIGMIEPNKAKRIIQYYRSELSGLVDTRPLHVNWAWLQAVISLGDSSLSRILVDWGSMGGDMGSWRRVLRKTKFDWSYVINGYGFDEVLPWDNIVIGERVEEVARFEYLVWKKLFSAQ